MLMSKSVGSARGLPFAKICNFLAIKSLFLCDIVITFLSMLSCVNAKVK